MEPRYKRVFLFLAQYHRRGLPRFSRHDADGVLPDTAQQIHHDWRKPMKHEDLKVANQDNLNEAYCPLPLSVIPNHMGINLCSVESVAWTKQDDGQLVSLTINFNPEPKE